ncbi:FAST kinase domain-containing protein 5 [Sciurus carolinensis]|uniref:FAST kinase domain-containing protein 5 n=1 Tax=Sciurus carolinensis TaxID=30640 RepID=A0AA41SXF6_SCICA|nr:FAST kinase domain-containing protein 5 [Sciurus carolinensis]
MVLECPDYTGSHLSSYLQQETYAKFWNLARNDMSSKPEFLEVLFLLENILGGPQYIKHCVILPHTLSSDLEVQLDVNMKPLPFNREVIPTEDAAKLRLKHIGVSLTDDFFPLLKEKARGHFQGKIESETLQQPMKTEKKSLGDSLCNMTDILVTVDMTGLCPSAHVQAPPVKLAIQLTDKNQYCYGSINLLGLHNMKMWQLHPRCHAGLDPLLLARSSKFRFHLRLFLSTYEGIFFFPIEFLTSMLQMCPDTDALYAPMMTLVPRNKNFSKNAQNLFLMRRDMATQKIARDDGLCVCWIHGQAQDFCILFNTHQYSAGFRLLSCTFPHHMATKNQTKSSETDCEDPSIFKSPKKTTLFTFQIPETSMMDKSHSTVAVATPGRAMTTQCHSHKPSQVADRDTSHVDETCSGDEYVPMNTLPSILLAMERAGRNAQNSHNPRSPGSPHFVPPSCSPAALLSHKDLIRGSKIQPPALNCSLKSGHRGKYTLSLSHLLTISRSLFALSGIRWILDLGISHWISH